VPAVAITLTLSGLTV